MNIYNLTHKSGHERKKQSEESYIYIYIYMNANFGDILVRHIHFVKNSLNAHTINQWESLKFTVV